MACGIIKFLHPPTAIHAAVYCNFFNKREKSLVVAGLNFVQVYRLNVLVPPRFDDRPPIQPSHSFTMDYDDDDLYATSETVLAAPAVQQLNQDVSFSPENVRLECVASYELFGTVVDLKASSLPNSNRDLLLLSFADAKLSAVQYDPIVNDLRSISLHDYEASKFSDEMPTNLAHAEPCVRIDPDSRCAVMRLYRTELVVVPFSQPPIRSDNALNGPKPITQFKSFVLNLKHIKEEHTEFIQDFQLLPGYLEPTVAVMCHKTMSWPGRIAVSSDTCFIAALSINTREKTFHVIWSCMGLPYDSLYIQKVPRPVGGLLVFSASAVIYVNQGLPSYGVSVNSITVRSTRFPLKPQLDVVAVLDGSRCAFFEPERFLLSLRNGNVYVVTVVYDNTVRTIRELHWQQVLANRYSSCVTPMEGGYLFLGGKLCDSKLFTYSTSQWIEAEAPLADEENGVEKTNLEVFRPQRKPLLDNRMDDEDIYGPNAFVSVVTTLKKYHFTACDTIVSMGPCRTSAVGEPISSLEDFTPTPDKDADFVTCSGFENESFACAMHRTIRPDVLASFDLQHAQDLWTLKEEGGGEKHAYVVVTDAERTSVFQSGEEIIEAEQHPFQGDERTIFCYQMLNGQVSLQVTRFHVRISTSSSTEVRELQLEETEEIQYATGLDLRLAFITNQGKLIMLEWDYLVNSLLGVDTSLLNVPGNGIVAVSLFVDRSGIFSSRKPSNVGTTAMEVEPETLEVARMDSQPEDEDELLYGSHVAHVEHMKEQYVKTPDELHKFLLEERVNVMPFGFTDWLLVVRSDGTMAIYNLPELRPMFETHPFIHSPRVIHDIYALDQPNAPADMISSACAELHIKEVLLVGLGVRQMQPYLFVVINEDIFIYHVVPFYYGLNDSRLRICFSRLKHDMLTRERKLKKKVVKDTINDNSEGRLAKRHLRQFTNVGGYSGVFLCFPYSYLVLATDRNILRCHPLIVDGPIKAFAEFSNANCDAGFVYYNAHKQIRVAELEPQWNYDFPWPMTRVKVPGTIHCISYHLECKTYVICSAVMVPEKRIVHGGVDQVETELNDYDPRFILPLLPKFSIHLITPDEWQLVPEASYNLQDFEHVTGMKVIPLKNGAETGMKEYVVIATNFAYGEDVQSRGRIILLDVLDVIPEPDKPLTRFRQKEIYAEEQKGPVTALCGVNGYIVSAIGQKVFIWGLKGTSLIGVAFLDVQIYVHQLTSIKDLILVADIQRSVSIIRFQEKYRTLSLVSADPNQMHTYAAEFCVDNQSLTVAVTDIRQDFHVFQFDPDYYFSAFGNRLVRRMECNLGQYVTNMFRLRCSAWYPDAERVAAVALTKKHVTAFTTLDGAIGCYMNIPERTYRRIMMIETILSNHCIHRAGLSPRLYWNAKTSPEQRFDLVGNVRTVADAKVGSLYMELDQTEKQEVASKIGCSVDALVEEILDIERQTSVF